MRGDALQQRLPLHEQPVALGTRIEFFSSLRCMVGFEAVVVAAVPFSLLRSGPKTQGKVKSPQRTKNRAPLTSFQ